MASALDPRVPQGIGATHARVDHADRPSHPVPAPVLVALHGIGIQSGGRCPRGHCSTRGAGQLGDGGRLRRALDLAPGPCDLDESGLRATARTVRPSLCAERHARAHLPARHAGGAHANWKRRHPAGPGRWRPGAVEGRRLRLAAPCAAHHSGPVVTSENRVKVAKRPDGSPHQARRCVGAGGQDVAPPGPRSPHRRPTPSPTTPPRPSSARP